MREMSVSCYVIYLSLLNKSDCIFCGSSAVVLGTYVDAPEFLNGAECNDFLQQIVPVIALVIVEVSDWGFGWGGK